VGPPVTCVPRRQQPFDESIGCGGRAQKNAPTPRSLSHSETTRHDDRLELASRATTCCESLVTTKEQLEAFLAADFPQTKCIIEEVGQRGATVSRDVGTADLRPGGTVSGPVLMGVADLALYVAILGEIGIVPLAVTTSLTINFLRKPASGQRITGVCKLLKMGKSLAVGEVWLYSAGSSEPVAHVVGSYSIPPRAEREAP
jgi:acyl-coenzyme A thioesterase PaaI-like protein